MCFDTIMKIKATNKTNSHVMHRLILCIIAACLLVLGLSSSAQPVHASLVSASPAVTATSSCTSGLSCGLVGYWTFDGKDTNWATGKTQDKSGNGNTGSLIGMSTTSSPVKGAVGQALSFNGATGDINLGTWTISGTSNITLSSWVRGQSSKGGIISRYDNHGYFGVILYITGGKTYFSVGNDGTFQTTSGASATSMNDNKWHLVTGVYDHQNVNIYVDGVKQNSNPETRNFTDLAYNWCVGSDYYDCINEYSVPLGTIGAYSGSIDDVRIYKRALAASEVSALYNMGSTTYARSPTVTATSSCTSGLSCGLVGYWTFDGKDTNWATGKTLDKSGSGNTGSLIGMSTTTSPVTGKVGQGLYFSSVGSNWVSVADSPSLNISTTNAFTISLWLQLKQVPGSYLPLIYKSDAPSFWLNNVGAVLLRPGGSVTQFIATCSVMKDPSNNNYINRWYHLVGTYDGTTERIYANGAQCGQQQSIATAGSNSNPLYIGNSPGGSLKKSLDDVRIYNRALSASEVSQLYSMGSTTFAKSPAVTATSSCTSGLSCGLVGYWTFDGKDTNWATGKTLDKSGSGNTGSLIGMSTTTSPVTGKVGQGLGFNGVTSYVNVANLTSEANFSTTTFSLSFWMKSNTTNAPSDGYTIISKDGRVNGWKIRYTNGRIYFVLTHGYSTNNYTGSDYFVGDGKWHHIAITIKTDSVTAANNYAQMFIDSTPQSISSITSNTYVPTSAPVQIGEQYSSPFTYFPGSLDDVRIYNRALSAGEVLQLYNAGR